MNMLIASTYVRRVLEDEWEVLSPTLHFGNPQLMCYTALARPRLSPRSFFKRKTIVLCTPTSWFFKGFYTSETRLMPLDTYRKVMYGLGSWCASLSTDKHIIVIVVSRKLANRELNQGTY